MPKDKDQLSQSQVSFDQLNFHHLSLDQVYVGKELIIFNGCKLNVCITKFTLKNVSSPNVFRSNVRALNFTKFNVSSESRTPDMVGSSVTGLGDLLDFGQLFKTCGNN